MPRHYAASLALALLPLPALADITASEVWENWLVWSETTGQSLTAEAIEETRSGLVLSGVTSVAETSDAVASARIDRIELNETGDGAVTITASDSFPMSVTFTSDTGESGTIDMVFDIAGMSTVARGQPDAMTYDITAPAVALRVDRLAETGAEALPVEVAIALSGLAGTYAISQGETATIAQDLTASALDFTVAGTDPEDPSSAFDLRGSLQGIRSTATGTLGALGAFADLEEMLAAGMQSENELTYASGSYTLTGSDEGQTFSMTANGGAGVFSVAISPDGLRYGGSNSENTIEIASSDLPVPSVSLGIARSDWTFAFPILPSDGPEDFTLALGIDGLVMSDTLWSQFDPMGAIPRDPARVNLRIEGTGQWLVDITDPEAIEGDEIPGRLDEARIEVLEIELAGISLTGDGAFEFSDVPVQGGAPFAATGGVNLTLVGALGLMDRLVERGMLPAEQAAGVQMMLGMLARPGEGTDTLVSRIEVTPSGILANGLPLPF